MKTKTILTQKRDKTYYKFDNVFYGKARLVHALVAKIAKRYSFEQINEILDPDFKSTFHLCETYYGAKKLSTNYKRFFVEKDEVLVDKFGIRFCICNQIGVGNISPIIKIFRNKFNFKINTIKAIK